MRETGASTTLVVCFDGQFWVGLFKHVEDGCLSACRVVFGAEPSNEEVLEFVLRNWNRLRFSKPIEHKAKEMATNPKRRQREAARELRRHETSTKAQTALAEQREASVLERKSTRRDAKEADARARFEQRTKKRKQKRRGH